MIEPEDLVRMVLELEPLIAPEDIPPDVARRLALCQHKRECGSFDGGSANRTVPPPPFTGPHEEVCTRRAAIRLSQLLVDLGVSVEDFDIIVDRRLWN